jgi:hypothetical protein
MIDSKMKIVKQKQEIMKSTDESAAAKPLHSAVSTYLPPQLTPLGRWEAVTLIQSVPIGPGSFGFPSDNRY